MEYTAITTESAFRFSTGRNTRMGEYRSRQVEPRNDIALSNATYQERFPQIINTENNLEEWFPYSGEPAQFLNYTEFSWPIELQTTKAEISTDASVFRFGSGNFIDQAIAVRETFDRIAYLKELAANEGIEISTYSEKDLRSFLVSVEFTRRPYIALLDNGNFRVIWKNADREQIGMQFRGRGLVHYVLFALRSPDRFMAQATGRDTLQNVGRQIDAQGLGRLMTE